MARTPFRCVAAAVLVVAAAGCESPLDVAGRDRVFIESIDRAIDRELAGDPGSEEVFTTEQKPSEVERTLADRREELDRLSPGVDLAAGASTLGPDLAGQDQRRVSIDLQAAVTAAVRSNLGVQIARLQPAINESDVISAEAVFDAVLFGNVDLSKIDEPDTQPVLNRIPLGTPFNASERYRFETGVRKRFTYGTELTVSTDLTRLRNNAPGISLSPDPAYTAAVRLGLTQPLLRGFGAEVNTATIRLAMNAEQRSVQQLRSDLLRLVADVEVAYWNLVAEWDELAIRDWLVDVGTEVRDVLERRLEFDTKLAQFSDAVARVEQRRAEVIRARRRVRAASDRLKLLMNDSELPVGSEVILVPADDPIVSPIDYNARELVATALEHRPEIQQAVLNIDDAEVRRLVADNGRLPILDLSAQLAYTGLDSDVGGAYDEVGDADFINYVLGLVFETPLGNRGPEAEYRKRRLERSASVLAYQRAVQEVVFELKAALRDVITNYELIEATRSFRVAQAENLRTLLVEEQTLASLTPEFLDLKFTRQERLAVARQDEVRALAAFDQSVAELYRAMGVGLKMKQVDVEIIDDPDAVGLTPGGTDAQAP